jgi:hypothetical protein
MSDRDRGAVPQAIGSDHDRGALPQAIDPDHDRGAFASPSLARHLARGAIGFGLVGAAFALTPSIGPLALLLAPGGIIALRGCPMCWIAGLVATISAGRLRRDCVGGSCTLRSASTAAALETPRV